MTAAALAARVRAHRFPTLADAPLRQATRELLGGTLTTVTSTFESVDMFVDDVVVIVRTDGSAPDVLRQVQQLAKGYDVAEVLIVSTCSGHSHLPALVGGKRLAVTIARGAR